MNEIKREIPVLDNLRAIAAWSVCLYHFVCTTTGFVDSQTVVYKIFNFGSYGVQLFFVISGLVIPWSLYHGKYHIKNFFKFFIKRLARLEPPYIVSALIMLAIIVVRKYSPVYNHTQVSISAKQLMLHIGYLIPFFKDVTWLNNVYWTLAIEFQYYILIGVLYFLFISKKIYVRAIAYLLILVLPVLLPYSTFLPFWLPVFGIGILIFLYKTFLISRMEFILVNVLCSIDIFIYNEKTACLVSVASGLMIVFAFTYTNKILAWLGRFSYSVYLMHAIVGAAAVNVLSHYATNAVSKVVICIIGIGVTFISSYGMYLFVEKPSKKLSSKLAYRKSDVI